MQAGSGSEEESEEEEGSGAEAGEAKAGDAKAAKAAPNVKAQRELTMPPSDDEDDSEEEEEDSGKAKGVAALIDVANPNRAAVKQFVLCGSWWVSSVNH